MSFTRTAICGDSRHIRPQQVRVQVYLAPWWQWSHGRRAHARHHPTTHSICSSVALHVWVCRHQAATGRAPRLACAAHLHAMFGRKDAPEQRSLARTQEARQQRDRQPLVPTLGAHRARTLRFALLAAAAACSFRPFLLVRFAIHWRGETAEMSLGRARRRTKERALVLCSCPSNELLVRPEDTCTRPWRRRPTEKVRAGKWLLSAARLW